MQNLKLGVCSVVTARPWSAKDTPNEGIDKSMGNSGDGPISRGKTKPITVPANISGWKHPKRSIRMPQSGALNMQINEVVLNRRPASRDEWVDNCKRSC